jgi:hypothetical protein
MVDLALLTRTLDQVEGGSIPAYQAVVDIRTSIKLLEEALDQVKEQATAEIKDLGATSYKGWRVEFMAGTARHSFEHIDEWLVLKGKLHHIEQQAKMARSAYDAGRHILDPETGELFPPSQVKYTTDTVKITVQK